MELGKTLVEIRKQHNLTQEDLAEKFHVTRQTISNWENGKSFPDLETLICISDAFRVSLDTMLKGDKEMVREMTKEQVKGRKQKQRIVITVLVAIVVVLGVLYVLHNTSTLLKPEDYTVTVKEITLEDVSVDKNKRTATYIIGDAGIDTTSGKDVYVFNGEEYNSLMTRGRAFAVTVTTDKRFDSWSLEGVPGEPLSVELARRNANLLKRNLPSRQTSIQLEAFDKIYDLNTGEVMWKK
ncbi:MAG: helix-turn-helix domain-containing protein [Firmicutes bacterium]|nr:helix-turn-helix domain-containing protein [Bacillota bacterium]